MTNEQLSRIEPATTPLDAARDELARRTHAADLTEDWPMRNLYEQLHTVSDHVCRIGDHTHSAHYQASKAGPLVDGAIRVRAAAFRRYSAIDTLTDATEELLIALDSAVAGCLWSASRTGGQCYRSNIADLRDALGAFQRWTDEQAEHALLDDDDV